LAVPAYCTDDSGNVTACNSLAAKLWVHPLPPGGDGWSAIPKEPPFASSPAVTEDPALTAVRTARSCTLDLVLLEGNTRRRVQVHASPLVRPAGAFVTFAELATGRPADDAQQRLAAIIASSDDAIVSEDLEGTISTWNRGAERLFGYTEAEAIGLAINILVPPDRLAEESQVLSSIRAGRAVEHYETVRRRKNGSPVQVSISVSPIHDARGRVIGASTIARDLTEHRFAEGAVHHLAAIVEFSDDAIISKDLAGVILTWNAGAERLFGYKAREIVGRSVLGLIPEDRREEEPNILMRIARGEHIRNYETVRRRKDGSLVDVALTVSPVRDATGRVVGASKIARDISERKRAEQDRALLAAIVESSDDAIISKDLDGVIRSWNAGAERLYGYTRSEAVGRSVTLLMPPDRVNEEPFILSRIRRGERIDHYETVRRKKSGELIEVSLSVSPIHDRSGRVIGASKIARDITERKTAERDMLKAHEAVLAASRAKDDFLAALSHELRTPLNPVLLLASNAAADETLPDRVRADFAQVRDNVELEARLIDDLLDLTRVARGKLALDFAPVSLSAVLAHALTTVQPELQKKRLRAEVALPPPNVVIRGDAVRLQQVFWNVLRNAVKFTAPGGRITITAELRERSRAVVTVADTGIGMTAAEVERVFDSFVQGDHAVLAPHRFGGLGLGLAISRKLIELHQGTITAASEGPGRGSRFTVELPAVVAPNLPAQRASAPGRREAQPPGRPVGRILVVEDHQPTRDALTQLLRRRGFETTSVGSAAEAREAVASGLTWLICDIGLPDGTGYELMEELQRRHGVIGIAMTGYGMDQDIQRSRAAGFAAHLTKPVSIQALDAALAALVSDSPAPAPAEPAPPSPRSSE
jgi:PAS domain S-box-containing protein